MHSTHSDEEFIRNRYKSRSRWPEHLAYKHVKAGRIVRILKETGDVPTLAVEVGVGQGGVAAAVSRHGIAVVGIDLSADSIARARANCSGANVRLLRASGFSLPFQSGSVAVVYASQVLHLFDSPSRLAMMEEVRRVLRPGGRFVFDMKNVSTHLVQYLRYSRERKQRKYPSKRHVMALLRQSGYSSIETRPGVLPLVGWTHLPNLALFRGLAHTTFFVATKPEA